MPLIEPGRKAPDFTLPDAAGTPCSLRRFAGWIVVLYFYPEDDTPLCTAQACGMRDINPELDDLGAAVIGISPDDPARHAAFAQKYGLNFHLLADHRRDRSGAPKVSARYGAWRSKSMYGREVTGIVRTTYILSPDLRIARRFDHVKTPTHAQRIRDAVRELRQALSA
ncbi:MAG: peroxiredoxin [Phycisphaeraceae bacterium]|nr:peroxiredoxin [Phycisphaeraceae bacterium]MCW5755163.1 peroxiredoxin [Phycisphaeraceae bacterium]